METKMNGSLVVKNKLMAVGKYSEEFQKWVSRMWNENNLAKKEYSILANQTSTNEPTMVTLFDSITGISFIRSAVGTYLFNKPNGFPTGKSLPATIVDYTDAATGNRMVITPVSSSQYKLETYLAVDTTVLADGVLTDQEINLIIFE